MHRMILAAVLSGLSMALVTAPATAEPDVEMMANSCAICHGTDGRSPDSNSIDSLADLSADEFIEEMQEFKFEKGEGRIMGVSAQGYTDQQIRALAQYFQSLRR